MSASVECYVPSARAEWDALVGGARARHFLFERAYMDYHSDRFEDSSLFVLWKGRPIAVLPASRHGYEVVSHGGLTFGGLLSGPELTAARTVDAVETVRRALRADGARRLVYKPMPHLYQLAAAEEDLFALYAAGARLERRELTAAVPAGHRPAYSSERARGVRRGRASGLVLGESDAIAEYMALLREVLVARHGVEPVHTAAEMELLAARFPGRIRLFAASEAGAIVAGVVVFETPSVAHAQYIASGPRGRELGALDALFDHLLARYADRWFDFGISNERDGTLNEGLMRNKEGFGARAVAHDRYVLEL